MIVDGDGPYDARFEAIYRTRYGRVYRYFRANNVADDEAHDLAQDTFKRVFERMGSIRSEEPGAFVAAVARTILLNRVRSRQTLKRTGQMVAMDDPELYIPDPAPPDADYAEREAQEARRAQVRTVVAALPAGQRECLRLWIQGFKYEEITKILGITMDAVKSRLRDAKRYLRTQLGVTK